MRQILRDRLRRRLIFRDNAQDPSLAQRDHRFHRPKWNSERLRDLRWRAAFDDVQGENEALLFRQGSEEIRQRRRGFLAHEERLLAREGREGLINLSSP